MWQFWLLAGGMVALAVALILLPLRRRPVATSLSRHALNTAIFRERLAGCTGMLARLRDQVTDPSLVVYRPLESLLMPRPWYTGRIVLIGDAAHATTPHLASGASIAIEDSVVLARLLAAGSGLAEVLDDFTARRFERCRMIVDNSERLGEWEKHPGSPDDDTVGVVARSYRALAQAV